MARKHVVEVEPVVEEEASAPLFNVKVVTAGTIIDGLEYCAGEEISLTRETIDAYRASGVALVDV